VDCTKFHGSARFARKTVNFMDVSMLVKVGRHYRRYGVPADDISVPANSASEIVKFTISIPRESCTNPKAKYSSSVVPPDPSVHFYHCQYDVTDGREIVNYIYRPMHCRLLSRFWTSLQSDQNLCGSNVAPQQQLSIDSLSLLPAAADLSSKPAAQAAVDLWDRQTRAEGRMDGRTDGRTDTRQFYDAYRIYYADRIIRTTVPVSPAYRLWPI